MAEHSSGLLSVLKYADKLMKYSDFQNAIIYYLSILKVVGDSPHVYVRIAHAYRFLGDIENSKIHFSKAHVLDPKNFIDYYKADESINPFETIRSISIELSNDCNYSTWHKKCPAHDVLDKKTLSSDMVHKILDELSIISYTGELMWHLYNEPLMDPRLVTFIKYAKSVCPASVIHLWTNGFYLTQAVADEVVNAGASRITISAYTDAEYERLSKLEIPIIHLIEKVGELDLRKEMYSNEEIKSCVPCITPSRDIVVRFNGDVVICCLDWKNSVVFGNIYNQSLKEILSSTRYKEVSKSLRYGIKDEAICRRCNWKTWII
ncbi:MAG: SPASM domain-containing protein [Nitrospirae bacterium]|nr:SPASM domain-containing protein [Nitrospirota bacterium]